ncbi:MAG TPA: hypothetical protein VG754_04200 [Verrucomicrobiae bacterium]|nr:hypothetical protein [Verrucomicrobiae bacterium]
MSQNISLVVIILLAPVPLLVAWWMSVRKRKREAAGPIEDTARQKAERKDFEKKYWVRILIARIVVSIGSLFFLAPIYFLFDDKANLNWKEAAGMAGFGAVLLAFAISLIKNTDMPTAVHLNRAAFFVYVLFFGIMLWRLRLDNLPMVVLVVLVLLLLATAGLICSFSRALPARWILAALQIGIAAFFAFLIFRSRGPALWGHPVAVGLWAAVTCLLVISLFGTESNIYYAIQVPQQSGQAEINQNHP